jgi:hypothetical protein
MSRIARYAVLLAALLAVVVAGAALASPGHKAAKAKTKVAHVKKSSNLKKAVALAAETPGTETGSEPAGAPESAADDAAQAAACQKAGIDPNADNVNFDDATGTCTTDAGGQSGTN